MSQQSICVYAALAINSFACSEPEGMEDTTPLLGMNYSHFDQKPAKKQAKTEEHNVESARAIDRWRMWEVWQRKMWEASLAEEASEYLQSRQGERENSNNCWRMTRSLFLKQ